MGLKRSHLEKGSVGKDPYEKPYDQENGDEVLEGVAPDPTS